jgi:hypothetical protein
MVTEHTPVFPKKEKWQCSCGMINDFISYVCAKCGKSEILSTYSNPCDRCGLCGDKLKTRINCDFLVRDDVRY